MRVLIANTHVGTGFTTGAMGRLKRRTKPHLVLLSEAQNPAARKAARRLFPRLLWIAGGLVPRSTNPGSAGTLVFARRSVFRRIGGGNPLVSSYLDRWHPVRRTTWLRLALRSWRRPAGGRVRLLVSSAHTWTLGQTTSPEHRAKVHTGHQRQVDAYGQLAADGIGADDEVLLAGDWNEPVGNGGTYVETVMRVAGLVTGRPGGLTADAPVRLMEAFVSAGLEVVGYELIDPEPGMDHLSLLLDVRARDRVPA